MFNNLSANKLQSLQRKKLQTLASNTKQNLYKQTTTKFGQNIINFVKSKNFKSFKTCRNK